MKKYVAGLILLIFIASVASVSAFTVGDGSTESVCSTQTALFVVPVEHEDSSLGHYTVSLSGNAAKWAVAAPSGFTLDAGETTSVFVYATPSINALPGSYELKVTVTAGRGESHTVVNTLEVENCHQGSLFAEVDALEACAGVPAQFSIDLTNDGAFSEMFELALSGDGARYATLSNDVVKLDAGETRELLVTIDTNEIGLHGITVTAQSIDSGVVAIEKLQFEAKGCYDFEFVPEKNYFSFCENVEVKVPFVVENRGTLPNTYALLIDGPKWAFAESTEVTVPSESSELVNIVLFPGYGVEGDFKVRVQAVGEEGDVSVQKEIVANVLECHSTSLEIPKSDDTVCPFTDESYEVSLANLGEYVEHYVVTVTGADWVAPSEEFIDVEAGESGKFTLDISPRDVESGQYVLKVNAESQDSCHSSNSDVIAINIASRDSCFGVKIDAQYESVDVVYGEGALVPVVVENKGTEESIYTLEVSGTGASYAQLNPGTLTLGGGESETAYLYISMPEQTPKNVYSLTVSARLEDGTLSDSDKVEVRLITGDIKVDLVTGDEDIELVVEEEKEGIGSKLRGIVGGVIGVVSGGASKITGALVSKTAGFSNWVIILGLVVLVGIIILVWKLIGELEGSPKEKKPKTKKGLWQRFIDFLEEDDDDEWGLNKKPKKGRRKR
jgi:uncharacterized membrane protein